MTVSVIIPNFNHAKYLSRRIDSILNQTYRDFELIILDDCSTDNSRNIIDDYVSRYPGIITFYNNINSGSPFAQWNLGVRMAKGEFIWIAESDDFAEPAFLERTVAALNENRSAGLVYTDSKVHDERNDSGYLLSEKRAFFNRKKWMTDYSLEGKKEILEHLYLANTINNASAVLFRKEKYIEVLLEDESMKYCGDWFIYIRILLISDISYIAMPLNNFRIHSKSSFHFYFLNKQYPTEVIQVQSYLKTHLNIPLIKQLLMFFYRLWVLGKQLRYN
jgi:glycosyltransferase involved in cell wall biosynthesis